MEQKQLVMEVTLPLMQNILDYLAKRPYQEVFTLVEQLRNLPPAREAAQQAAQSNITELNEAVK